MSHECIWGFLSSRYTNFLIIIIIIITGTHMPYGITQCYLPPGRGDIPASITAKAGTRFSYPGGMQGWVDLGGWLGKWFTRIPVTHHELTELDVD